MNIDLLTLSISVGFAFFIESIVLLFIYKINNYNKGILLWILGTLSVSLGFFSIYIRQFESVRLISIIGANLFQIGGIILLYLGIKKFIDEKPITKILISIFILFSLSVFYFTFFDNNINARTVIFSFVSSVLFFIITFTLGSSKIKSIKSALTFISAFYFIVGLFTTFRVFYYLFFDHINDIFAPSLIQTLTFFATMVSGVAVTFGFIVMIFTRVHHEMNEAKDHFELIFNTIPDSITVTRIEDGSIINSNEGFSAMTGYSKEDLINKTTLDLNIWKNPDDRVEIIKEVTKNGFSLNNEFTFLSKEGKEIEGLFSTKIIISNGNPYILSITRDITERKRIDAEIKLKNKQLEESNAEKDKFFSIMAHDLKGPFNSFLGLTEVLADGIDYMGPDIVKKIALNMNTSARNIYILLENLLEWSRIKRNQLSYSPEQLNVTAEIGKVVDVTKEMAEKKSIKLKVNSPENLEVFADTYMLQSVLRNLVTNAVKFTFKRGTITISAKKHEDNSVFFSVADNGTGIDKETKDKLFKIDLKVGKPGTEGELSTGIGLLICKELINKHNGNIWVESEENKGSVFCFTIPMSEVIN